MRKWILVVLLMTLLVPALAAAEDGFSLRSGYVWGMSVEDAKALAEQEGLTLVYDEDVGNAEHVLTYEGATAGDYPAVFTLMFFSLPDERLALGHMGYGFDEVATGSDGAQALKSHLQTNLTAKYAMGTIPTLRGRDALLCWPLHDTLVELVNSSHVPGTDAYGVHYTAMEYVEERVDEGINLDGF